MLIPTAPRLFRLLLSLVVRLFRSFGRTAFIFRVQFSSLWQSVLALARRSGQSNIRLHANEVPATESTGDPPRNKEPVDQEKEAGGTLAALPVRRPARWQDDLPIYQALTAGNQFKSDLVAATPEGTSQRYKPRPAVGRSPEQVTVEAGQDTLLHALPQLPAGWRRHVHPEGSVLYYHEGLRIFTESDVISCNKEIIFHASTLVKRATETSGVTMDELTEIVLNVDENGRWFYYLVDHTNRLLFWVHPVNSSEDLGINLQSVSGYNHIRYLVEARYWYAPASHLCSVCDMDTRTHCEFYPHNRTLPGGVSEELRGMLNYAKTDMMTADLSTSPFAQDELVAISDLVNSLTDAKISDPYNIWVIARLMSLFTENQFLNFCGQSCARLNADTPLFGRQTWDRSKVFKVVNLFLFGSVSEHAVRLRRLWVDGIIIQPRWKSFISRLTNELSRYTLFSTVMLAVNISFLAVPGVIATNPPAPAGAIQIIIYCSVVSTIGSIIFSFALMNVYSDPGLMGASTAAEVMRSLSQTKMGLACLAITHSLPIACLVWSIVLFATALALQIFLPKELPTVATLGVECGILVLSGLMSFIVMWLYSGNEQDEDEDAFIENNNDPVTRPQDEEQGAKK